MTPKNRAIIALTCGTPDFVLTMEIDFELNEELVGTKLILGETLCKLQEKEKIAALNQNIYVYIKTA